MNENGRFTFLNSTFKDLQGGRVDLQDLVGPVPRSWGFSPIGEGEGTLLTYCRLFSALFSRLVENWAYDSDIDESVLSRMITTIDDSTNGFRLELIPIAISSSDASSRGLLEATLALSSFHLGQQKEALMHKVKAIKYLSTSIQGDNANRIAQFSACMMLCVYSVCATLISLELFLLEDRFLMHPTLLGVYISKVRKACRSRSPSRSGLCRV